MSAMELILAHHRAHYEAGTLEQFLEWFDQSGHGEMMRNPYLLAAEGRLAEISSDRIPLEGMSGLRFENRSASPWRIGFAPVLAAGVQTVEDLFRNFVRCTGHTHPIGDFRTHLGYFVDVLTGPRYILFHGQGSCLLLGAMFQALALRTLSEPIDLHYSHTATKDFTHVFATWKDAYFVDADQKTWAPIGEIDRWPSLGYIFQQIGVAGHLVYSGLTDDERVALFSTMTRDYFKFYDLSVTQYMYRSRHELAELAERFREARTKYCSDLSLDATDFSWKEELRRKVAERNIPQPCLLAGVEGEVGIEVAAQGALRIGFGEQPLPGEIEILAAIFFGHVPGILSMPVLSGSLASCHVPEFPWMIFFDSPVESVTINGQPMRPVESRCGRFRYLGMGLLESAIDLNCGDDGYQIDISAIGATTVNVVLPFNAFALSADLVRCNAQPGSGRKIEGRFVQ